MFRIQIHLEHPITKFTSETHKRYQNWTLGMKWDWGNGNHIGLTVDFRFTWSLSCHVETRPVNRNKREKIVFYYTKTLKPKSSTFLHLDCKVTKDFEHSLQELNSFNPIMNLAHKTRKLRMDVVVYLRNMQVWIPCTLNEKLWKWEISSFSIWCWCCFSIKVVGIFGL